MISLFTDENVEGENLIAKAGRNGDIKRQKLPNKVKSSDGGGSGGGGGGGGGGAGGEAPTKTKRAQYCTICKNHNQRVLKKRHKCPHSDCQCPLCQLSRRVQCIMCHQQRLWRFRKSMEKNGSSQNNKDLAASTIASPSSSSSSSSSSAEGDFRLQESTVDDPFSVSEQAKTNDRLKPERHGKQQVCDKCRNHEEWVLKRGHKGKCPYENCTCQYCSFTIKRRDLMKHQQRVRRAQITIKPAKDAQDFVLQPAEGPAQSLQNQPIATSPIEDPADLTPGGLTPPTNTQEMVNKLNNNIAGQTDAQGAWLKCPNEEQNGPGVAQVLTNNHGLTPSISQKPSIIPFVKPEMPSELSVSPAMSHEPCISQSTSLDPRISPAFCQDQTISPAFRQETTISPAFQQEPTISPAIANEQRFTLDNRHERRVSPPVPSKPVISPPVSEETEITRGMTHESVMSLPVSHGISSAMSHEPQISPATAHESVISSPISHRIISAISQEPMVSSAMSHENAMSPPLPEESRISSAMSHESRISAVMSNEPRISPIMSHETVMSPPISHQPRISSTMSQDHRNSTAMPHDARISLQNCNDLRLTATNFHVQRIPRGISHEPRTSSSVFNESSRNCATFHQQTAMINCAGYTSMTAETMHTPLNYLKEEPIDDGMLYDSRRDLASSTDYTSPVQDFDRGINFANDADFHLARQQSHQKFGIDPEDLQLRHWETKNLGSDHAYPENFQCNNFRGSSLCIPLTPTQQPSLQQQNTLNQQSYYPAGNSNSTAFSPQSIPYGWGTPVGQPCISTQGSYSSTTVHTKHAILPNSPCQAYVHSPQNHNQALWWQQTRLGTMERMNSG